MMDCAPWICDDDAPMADDDMMMDSPMLGQCSCGSYMGMLVNPADDTDGKKDGCYCKNGYTKKGMMGKMKAMMMKGKNMMGDDMMMNSPMMGKAKNMMMKMMKKK